MDVKMAARTRCLLAQRMGFVLELRHRNISQSPNPSRQSQDINCCLKASNFWTTSVSSRKAPRLGSLAQPKKTWGICWYRWSWFWPWQHSAVVRKVRGHLSGNAVGSSAQPCSLLPVCLWSGKDTQLWQAEVRHRSLHNLRSLPERQSHGWERAWWQRTSPLARHFFHWSKPSSPSAPLNCSREFEHFYVFKY